MFLFASFGHVNKGLESTSPALWHWGSGMRHPGSANIAASHRGEGWSAFEAGEIGYAVVLVGSIMLSQPHR